MFSELLSTETGLFNAITDFGRSHWRCRCVSSFLTTASAQFTQQGQKLTGNDAVGQSTYGFSVALSADGNTAIAGGPDDNSRVGAAWVYTRIGGVWSQQGRSAGNDAVGPASTKAFPSRCLLTGTPRIVGGPNDNHGVGAAWVYTRSNGVWSQQGSKLVGTGAVGLRPPRHSVAISGDGNTAMVGGSATAMAAERHGSIPSAMVSGASKARSSSAPTRLEERNKAFPSRCPPTATPLSWARDDVIMFGQGVGAAFVYTRSGGVWTQQGSKLVGTGAVGASQQGRVALSGDGNTLIVGGRGDNGGTGAAWVYTRTNGVMDPAR